MNNRRRELQHLGIRLQGALLAQGFFYMAAGGIARQLEIRRMYTDDTKPFGFYEIDTNLLPTGLDRETLACPNTEQFLSQVLGHPVKAINNEALIYCVRL